MAKTRKKAAVKKRKTQKQIQYELDEFAEFLLDLFEEKKEQSKQNPLQLML